MSEYVKTILEKSLTTFDELRVAEFSPIIELDPANGLTDLRDARTTPNNSSITAVNGEIRLRSAATANSTPVLDTSEKGRYQPGIQALGGIAIRRPTKPTGNQEWRAGYFDDQDGYWIGEDATGQFVQKRVGGTDGDKVRPADWRPGAPLDEIDFTQMTVLRFPHQCYYQGPLIVDYVDVDSSGVAKIRTIHRFGPETGGPVLEQSKLPVRAEIVDNDSQQFDLFVGGRHYAVEGRYNPNRRETAERRFSASISTTLVPIISFKKRDLRTEKAKSCKVSGLGVLSDSDALLEIHLNPTLATAGNFNAITGIATAESALFSDIVTSSFTGGQVLDRSLVSGGSGNRSNFAGIRRLGFDIPDDATVTLAARTVSGTGTINAVFSVEEEWVWAALVPLVAILSQWLGSASGVVA
jgi:hypothetical protein